MKLFSGTANQKLAAEVAKNLKVVVAQSKVVRFGNSEVKVTIKEKAKNQDCIVLQSTSNPTDTRLMELFFFGDALKRAEAKKIIAVIPYFGYARQNREHQKGEAVSANVVIRFLETVGFGEVYTVDLHDEGTEGIFNIPIHNISALPFLAKIVKKELNNNFVVVSPDQGGVERARSVSPKIAVVEKKRDLNRIHQSKAVNLFGEVKNKIAVLVDDVITSGKTIIDAAELCLDRGAKKAIAIVTHHDFTDEAPNLLQNSCLERIYTTNSIELKPEQNFPKLVEISIAELIAKNI